MAKIGTAHIEIKPVVDAETLKTITEAIAKAVAEGVTRGMRDANKIQVLPSAGAWQTVWPTTINGNAANQ